MYVGMCECVYVRIEHDIPAVEASWVVAVAGRCNAEDNCATVASSCATLALRSGLACVLDTVVVVAVTARGFLAAGAASSFFSLLSRLPGNTDVDEVDEDKVEAEAVAVSRLEPVCVCVCACVYMCI
jgi:hypothetical protein